jgi:hypothetical protein
MKIVEIAADRGELLGYSIKDLNGLILVIDRLDCAVYLQILKLWHDERGENTSLG